MVTQLMVLGAAGDLPSGAQVTGRSRESSRDTDFYFLFLSYGAPDCPGWAKGGRQDAVCGCGGVLKGLWDFNGDILPLL